MGRISQARLHLLGSQVQPKIPTAASYGQRQKWLIIYNALVAARTAEEWQHIRECQSPQSIKLSYSINQNGTAAIETQGKGGRRKSYLTLEQEKEFLAAFRQKAVKGQIATAAQIKAADQH